MSELVKYLRIESFEPEKEKFLTSEVLNKLDRQYLDTKINVENLMLCVISHTFENSILPIDFDTYFNDRTFQDYTLNSITVRGCFNYGNKFHTELWKGYNHLAIIEIDGDINLFEKQIKSYKTKHRWDSNLIVCQSSDLEYCKKTLKDIETYSYNFMKEKNPHIWKQNEEEEYNFKKPILLRTIESFENGEIDINLTLDTIFDLTLKEIDEYQLRSYWTYTNLDDFCNTLLVKAIDDWQLIDDNQALNLIREMIDNTSNDGLLYRNGEALEARYNKVEGFVIDLILNSDLNNENEILECLKKDKTIYL